MNKTFPIFSLAILIILFSNFSGCKPEKSETVLPLIMNGGGGPNAPAAGDRSTFTADGVSFHMRYFPPKNFKTGSGDLDTASVSTGYWMAETEVTYELWDKVNTWATSHGYTIGNAGVQGSGACPGGGTSTGTNQHPVTCINWRDAIVWMNALTDWYNARTGSTYDCVYYNDPGYTMPIITSTDSGSIDSTPGSEDNPYVKPNAKGFRLPTSNEWELAARYIGDANNDGDISDTGEYYPGEYASGATADYTNFAATSAVAWFGNSTTDGIGNTISTQPVGTKAANALGLYDMSGSVWEWSSIWYTSIRTSRGGSWKSSAISSEILSGFINPPYFESSDIGFRPSRTE